MYFVLHKVPVKIRGLIQRCAFFVICCPLVFNCIHIPKKEGYLYIFYFLSEACLYSWIWNAGFHHLFACLDVVFPEKWSCNCQNDQCFPTGLHLNRFRLFVCNRRALNVKLSSCLSRFSNQWMFFFLSCSSSLGRNLWLTGLETPPAGGRRKHKAEANDWERCKVTWRVV